MAKAKPRRREREKVEDVGPALILTMKDDGEVEAEKLGEDESRQLLAALERRRLEAARAIPRPPAPRRRRG